MQLSPETVRTASEEEGMLVGTDALELGMAEREFADSPSYRVSAGGREYVGWWNSGAEGDLYVK